MGEKSDKNGEGNVITPYQSFCLLIHTVIGVGVLGFQRPVIEATGPDAVWIILIGGVIFSAEVALLTWVMKRFAGEHFMGAVRSWNSKGRSAWLGRVLSLPFVLLLVVYWFAAVSFVARSFGEVLITVVLPRTPLEILMLVFLGVAAVAASNRLSVLARFSEFLFPFLLLPIPALIAVWMQEGKWDNFLPLFQIDWSNLLKGVTQSFLAFSGASVLFMFMGYYQQPQKAMRSHLFGAGFVIFSYWMALSATLAVFGIYEIKNLMWPLLDLITVLTVPGLILERLESAFLSIWMVTVFTTLLNLYGALVDALLHGFGLKERYRPYVAWGLLPLLYFTAFIPSNLLSVFRWGEWSGWFEPLALVLMLLFLFLLSLFRRKKNQGRQADAST